MTKALMSYALIAALSITLLGCGYNTVRYKAKVRANSGKMAEYTYQKTYSITGLQVGCILTFWIYGGACWAYIAAPFEGQERDIRLAAKSHLDGVFQGSVAILSDEIRHKNWNDDPQEDNIIQLQSTLAQRSHQTTTPGAFESAIVKKPTKRDIVLSNRSTFPDGWPQKWFYETAEYKYWTIKGTKASDSTRAMVASKIKADELITSEFPPQAYTTKMPYETTHNELKKIGAQYESWRIIRVKQEDVVMLKK